MARVAHRLHWFQAHDHLRRKKPWDVVFVDSLDDNRRGDCDHIRREIRILASLPYKEILETLGHEFAHLLCGYAAHGQSERDRADEEYVAELVEPSMVAFLVSMGVVIPLLPRGLAAMRRRMRKAS